MTNKNQIKTPKLELKRFRPSKLNKKNGKKSAKWRKNLLELASHKKYLVCVGERGLG